MLGMGVGVGVGGTGVGVGDGVAAGGGGGGDAAVGVAVGAGEAVGVVHASSDAVAGVAVGSDRDGIIKSTREARPTENGTDVIGLLSVPTLMTCAWMPDTKKNTDWPEAPPSIAVVEGSSAQTWKFTVEP